MELDVGRSAAEEPVAVKTCSRCKCDMDMVGILKGRETLRLIKLAERVDQRLPSYLPMFRAEILALHIGLLRRAGRRLSRAPKPVRDLLARERLPSPERSAL